jgi:hypothetical protein
MRDKVKNRATCVQRSFKLPSLRWSPPLPVFCDEQPHRQGWTLFPQWGPPVPPLHQEDATKKDFYIFVGRTYLKFDSIFQTFTIILTMKIPHFHILSLSVKSFSTSVKACHQNEHHFIQHSSSFRMSCIVDHKMFYIMSACNRILNYLKKYMLTKLQRLRNRMRK